MTQALDDSPAGTPRTTMPVLFVGHGSPMNAISDNQWARAFRRLAGQLPAPRAVLSVSAHWHLPQLLVTANERPRTIHDFGGFPQTLSEVQYPAAGSPELAQTILDLLGRGQPSLDWGLDHGTWSVLVHLLPEATCPVLQLSLDCRLSPREHIELGRALAPLRQQGVLILASGNITHNLRHAFRNMQTGELSTPAWALDFDRSIAAALQQRDQAHLEAAMETDAGRLSHPTPDHYLPLLYAFGASQAEDPLQFPVDGFDLGSLSMRTARFG